MNGNENDRCEGPMECAAKLPQGMGTGSIGSGAKTAIVEDAYTTKISLPTAI